MGSESDRRKTQRRLLKCRAYSVNSAKSGLIVNISEQGMAICYIDRKRWADNGNSRNLDITVDEHEFVLSSIPYSVVFEQRETNKGSDAVVIKRQGILFGELNMHQSQKLAYLIQHFTTDFPAER